MAVPTPPWQRPARPVQDRPPLSQRRIVDQALVLLAEEGLDGVSMRRVAQALGTGPASLYAHLHNKEELCQLMLDQLIGEVAVPEPDPQHWREQLKELMRSMVRAMTDHPGSAHLAIATRVPTGPNALRIMEGMLSILRSGGLSDRVTAFAGDLIGTYVSALALEAGTWAGNAPEVAAIAERTQQIRDYFAALPTDSFPHLVALAHPLTEGSVEERFEFGLEVLVAGLERLSYPD
ncbi:MAG TPA: TetR/AcrR family transcriptional regulator [Pseudonocardiaceae bacterium]|nr:TetR/AcrR family transcriptional regulator [Pseudonocardiaceae bacterium]